VVELVPDGATQRVTFSNRLAYAALAAAARTRELDAPVAAMRRGLGTVVPLGALALLNGDELRLLACGDDRVDVALLRAHTRYSPPYSEEHPAIQRFWRVYAAMPPEDQAAWIRFCWGRYRLPPSAAAWRAGGHPPFTIAPSHHGASDTALPTGHTCWFSVDLPAYSTDAVCARQLKLAIDYGSRTLGQA
jgi:hypothetical protein